MKRKKIPIYRKIHINPKPFSTEITKSEIIEALKDVKDGEIYVSLQYESGFSEDLSFGYNKDGDDWFQSWILIVKSEREETDDECEKRFIKEEEEKMKIYEKEKILYLKLKAKYEK